MSESHPLDFGFYVKCTMPLITALPSSRDRSLAFAWLKRLRDDKSLSEQLKQNYLKLLIYYLQMRKLDGPFLNHPHQFPTLSEFPQNINLFETKNPLKKKSAPFNSDFSGDLSTYVAHQDIENFGIHCYYAVSKHPITRWDRFDKNVFPTGIKPGGVKSAGFCDDTNEAIESTVGEIEVEERMKEFAEKLKKKVKEDASKKVMFVVPPIGKAAEPDDRTPPSWGSNLIKNFKFQDKKRNK